MNNTKSAFIAIVGKPNVGKSSLMNLLLGEKIAIVSDKPQTTRTKIMGVLTLGETQLVFTDTPGNHIPKTKLSEFMIEQINLSVCDVDIIMLVAEPTGTVSPEEVQLIEKIKASGGKSVLVINKTDILNDKSRLLERISAFSQLYQFDEVIPISAKTGEGTETLLNVLCSLAPESPHFFDSDTLTDQPERLIAAEIIREKLLLNLSQEVPHGIAVTVEKMRERTDKNIIDIDAEIICEKPSHKGIIIGKEGSMLKKIASEARYSLEEFFDCKINLKCWVKIRKDWRKNESIVKSLGFK